MPALREIQESLYRSLAGGDDTSIAQYVVVDGLPPAARLSVYRNTVFGTLTTALRLNFPAAQRLVGTDFFAGAAARFIAAGPPASAYLNDYGAGFPAFLDALPEAAGLPYLAGVARLEWAVSRALHAPDMHALDLARVAAVRPDDQGRVSFTSHPSVGLVHEAVPVDRIWRAVIDGDDAAMAAIDLDEGPVWLIVERGPDGVEVSRMDAAAWEFSKHLCTGHSIERAAAAVPEADAASVIAAHLAGGRFASFALAALPEVQHDG